MVVKCWILRVPGNMLFRMRTFVASVRKPLRYAPNSRRVPHVSGIALTDSLAFHHKKFGSDTRRKKGARGSAHAGYLFAFSSQRPR